MRNSNTNTKKKATTKTKKKNRLASGSIRVQRRYRGADGLTHTKSFTARTKAEAEALANDWIEHRRQIVDKITISTAVLKYIRMKEAVLSPNTVRGYVGYYNNYFQDAFSQMELLDVTNLDIQLWVSTLVERGLSPKTIKNVFGLLRSTLEMFMPDFPVKVTLPATEEPDLYCPSVNDVCKVLAASTHPEMRAVILLAAAGTMRRGEIAALTWEDVNFKTSTVLIRHAMAKDENGTWSVKAPKTKKSKRSVPMTVEVMNALRALNRRSSGPVFSISADQMTTQFRLAVKRSGVHPFRFHDLRHFSASQLHAAGIPDKYIEARGGWKPGSTVMQRTYQTVIDLEQKKQDKKILEAFSEIS